MSAVIAVMSAESADAVVAVLAVRIAKLTRSMKACTEHDAGMVLALERVRLLNAVAALAAPGGGNGS